jgi:oligopeptide/dipeptide ABC transporter ATP-binding protein
MSLLRIRDLSVTLPVGDERRTVLRNLDLDLAPGEALGVVGESGSGKSMTARAIARLLPAGAETTGEIEVKDRDVLPLADAALRGYQASEIAMIFQDPRVHINPVRTIGDFLTEALVTLRRMKRSAADRRAVELLADVGIHDGERRLRQYPHQLSGGLLQRVMIAAALAGEPALLLADEPTTALDVSTQSDVVAILDELRHERDMGLVFITHDLELAAAICDRIAVMYAGEIVEVRPSAELVAEPRHPYTAGLLNARPHVDHAVPRLQAIPGRPLAAFEAPTGCAFSDRCEHRIDECLRLRPPLEHHGTALVRCLRADQLDLATPLPKADYHG